MRIIKFPLRALAKASQFYVQSMNSYADMAPYAGAGWGAPVLADPVLPRSFSTSSIRSNREDTKQLIRAASTSTLGNRIDLSRYVFSTVGNANNSSSSLQKSKELQSGMLRGVPRSASVGMGRIEEDKPFEFGDNNDRYHNNNPNGVPMREEFRFFGRSRSCAVGSTRR